ncbi:Zinc metalloproteinase nas-13 [Exaiptasia diaphana]|nr:Zinc metalloproteinase nas-13 [Exaiptasia diaphana]
MSEKDKKDAHIFEGDIDLPSNLEESVDTRNCSESENAKVKVDSITNNSKRKAIRARVFVWRSRTVPIEITQEVANEKNGEKNVWDATKEIEKNTCVKFRKKQSGDKHWIKMIKDKGCWSLVGRQVRITNGQKLSIGDGCNHVSVILHELLHALGFWHEQSRTDRDKYVNILWENVQDGQLHNFNKYEAGQMDMVGGMYDFHSVMHYGNYAFSKNKKPTMLSIKDPNQKFGSHRSTLSKFDIVQIDSLYNCKTKSGSWSSWTDWGPCDLGCQKKRERFCLEKSKEGCPTADQHGIEFQKSKCEKDECNVSVPGHWGRWGTWTKCSKTCGHGYRTRSRLCRNPKPRKDGKFCEGPFVEAADCMVAKECKKQNN